MKGAGQRGMTLIELLVAMAIGLGLVLTVSTLLFVTENHKRTSTSTNDAVQTGAYVAQMLDRVIRGAGSGIAQSAYSNPDQGVLGCRLNVGSFLPRAGAFPAPFATNFLPGATATLRVAPVLIAAGQSDSSNSDVIVSMGGSGADGGVSRYLNGVGTATSLILQTAVGFSPQDLVIVSRNATTDCLLEEVLSTSPATNPTTLTLGTAYPYYTTGTTTTIATLAGDTTSAVTPVGNASVNDTQFQMFGVGTNYTLYSYDLLQNQAKVQGVAGDTSQAIADGVVQMNAIYGVAATGTSTINNWANPAAVGTYDIATVMAKPTIMKTIVAVRIALLVRGEYYDKVAVSPASYTFFAGLTDGGGASLAKTINLAPDPAPDRHYRYRVLQFTVPIRNMIVLAGGP